MKFGIFFELSVPRPLTRSAEQSVYRNALEQARLADELGFDTVWAVEHHFLEEYSHCSAPELFLTAVAMQTERIRVGHGAVVCVPQMNHPIRVAERAAVLDILSGGRLEFGTARASTWTELGGFGVDPDTTKISWDEYVHLLPRLWTEERVVPSTERPCRCPSGRCCPKPVQDPHPPMWVTVTTPGTELDAADRGHRLPRRGRGQLPGAGAPHARVPQAHRPVRSGELGRQRPGRHDELPLLPLRTTAWRRRRRSDVQRRSCCSTATFCGPARCTRRPPTSRSPTLPPPPDAATARTHPSVGPVPDGIAIGDPDRIVKAIKVWEEIGVDAVNFVLNTAEVIPQEDVLASMRLFAAEVMPAFRSGRR